MVNGKWCFYWKYNWKFKWFCRKLWRELSISDVLNLAVILETKARAVILSNETNLKWFSEIRQLGISHNTISCTMCIAERPASLIFHSILFSKIIQNLTYIYIYTYTLTHKYTHMHAYAYICVYAVYAYVRVHIYIIIYICTSIIRENRICRRRRVWSSTLKMYRNKYNANEYHIYIYIYKN